MIPLRHSPIAPRSAMAIVRQRIERNDERLWRLEDFRDLPFTAVAQALSRLTRARVIYRLSKGVYFRNDPTNYSPRRTIPASIRKLAARQKAQFPSGVFAATLLGFTKSAGSDQLTAGAAASGLPPRIVKDAVLHTWRPKTWAGLSESDAAVLDFLRHAGKLSELSPEQTARKTFELLAEPGRFERLLKVSASEPPRVRAMLGAAGEQLKKKPAVLKRLRSSLNPFSRFDFGLLAALPNARAWGAK